MPTPRPTRIIIGGVHSAIVKTCDARTITPTVDPTANRAMMIGSPAAMTVPNIRTRMTIAASRPAPSAAPVPPSASNRAASPPSSARSPSPSTFWTVSRMRWVSAAGMSSDGVSSRTVA